jgi:hypothetical protein
VTFYHYTCEHGYNGITTEGNWLLRPTLSLVLGVPLVWLTDLAIPDRWGLGLSSVILNCDRTTWRFEVWDGFEAAEKWPAWAHRHRLSLDLRDRLEGEPGARPLRWWVAEQPVPVVSVERVHSAGLLPTD